MEKKNSSFNYKSCIYFVPAENKQEIRHKRHLTM